MFSVKTNRFKPIFVGKLSQYFKRNPQSMLNLVLIEDILEKLCKLETKLLSLLVMGPRFLYSLLFVIISPQTYYL